jgi:Zn-dependent protease with chaperone function
VTGSSLDSIEPYYNLSAKAFEHPADRAATAALKAIPMLDPLVRRLIEWRYERALRQFYLGTSLKVSDQQCLEMWASHSAACRILDLPEVYELYLTTPVRGIAQTIGSKKPMIVLDSMVLQRLGPGEQRALLGHELGHVLSDHVLYITALNILIAAGSSVSTLMGLPFRAVQTVLLEWYRAAELSSDRAATLVVRDPQIVCRMLLVAASGLPAEQLNLDAFMAQALEYESWDAPSDRVRRFFSEINITHPYAVRRVSEVMRWVKSGEYDRIIRGEYRTRDQESAVTAEASDAMEFYGQRFRAAFRDLGENVTNLGTQVGGVTDQVADWLRSRGSGSGA